MQCVTIPHPPQQILPLPHGPQSDIYILNASLASIFIPCVTEYYKTKFSLILFNLTLNVKYLSITWQRLDLQLFQAYDEYRVTRMMIYLLVFLVVGTTAELQGKTKIIMFQCHNFNIDYEYYELS